MILALINSTHAKHIKNEYEKEGGNADLEDIVYNLQESQRFRLVYYRNEPGHSFNYIVTIFISLHKNVNT